MMTSTRLLEAAKWAQGVIHNSVRPQPYRAARIKELKAAIAATEAEAEAEARWRWEGANYEQYPVYAAPTQALRGVPVLIHRKHKAGVFRGRVVCVLCGINMGALGTAR